MNAVDISHEKSSQIKDYPDLMDVAEMCALLHVSTKTGYKLLREKKIECLKVGREYRIPKIHMLAFLKISKRQSSKKT